CYLTCSLLGPILDFLLGMYDGVLIRMFGQHFLEILTQLKVSDKLINVCNTLDDVFFYDIREEHKGHYKGHNKDNQWLTPGSLIEVTDKSQRQSEQYGNKKNQQPKIHS